MKPITVFLEFDLRDHPGHSRWKPGRFRGVFKDGYFIRYYWLCFAVAWVRMDLYDYNRHVASGATEWRG